MDNTAKTSKLFKEQHHKFSPKVWNETYLTQNTSNKALINFDVQKTGERGIQKGVEKGEKGLKKLEKYKLKRSNNAKWGDLPDLLLEQIFAYLSIRERYYASIVCKTWNRAFYFPKIWSQFVLEDSTLTRARFNYYQGWQYVLDHVRAQMCLTQVGPNFRKLTFEPMLNFFNLYEFMNMISWYCEQSESPLIQVKGIGSKIKALKFTFPCNMDNKDEDENLTLFGTGGKLLGALKRLMYNLTNLRSLELIDLMLDVKEAQHLLDDVLDTCCTTLHTLILVNTTKIQYPLLHVGVFLNLKVLKIGPQNLDDDVIELISQTNLKHLHIYQNRYTPDYVLNIVSPYAWKNCTKTNPKLSVHFELESIREKCLAWSIAAPVKSIIYDSHIIGVQLHEVMKIVELYKNTLMIYGHKKLPREHRSRSFHGRIDEPLIYLCRQCPKLKILLIPERISTSTVLLIATTCKNLKYLYVRRNAVIKKCEWEFNTNWSIEFYQWLKMNSKSYDSVEREVSQILGYQWTMLSDKMYKKIFIDLYNLNIY